MPSNYLRPAVCRASIAAFLAVVAFAPKLHAQTATGWKGTGDALWSNTANWDNGVPGGTVRDLYFGNGYVTAGGAGSLIANNDIVAYQGYRITWEDTALAIDPSFTITGNGFTLFDFGGVFPRMENDSTSLQTVDLTAGQVITLDGTNAGNKAEIDAVNGDLLFTANTGIALAGNTQLQFFGNNAKTLTINGVISGAGTGGLALNQNTTVILGGTNTYAGVNTISAGVLQVSSSANLGASAAANSITFASGNTGVLRTTGTFANSTQGVTLTGNGTLDVPAASTSSFTGTAVISGAGNLTKTGNGVLTLGATNTYTGKTIVTGGTLVISADANLGTAPGAAVADQLTLNNATLKFGAGLTFAANRGISVTGGAVVLDGNGNTVVMPNVFGGAGGVGTSVLFTNSNATAATFTISVSGVNGQPASSFTIDPNVTLNLGNNSTAGNLAGNVQPITINTGGILRFNRSNATSYNSDILGTGQVSVANNAGQIVTFNPTTSNSYSGGTNVGGTNATILGTTDTAFGTGLINFIGGGTVASSNATAHGWVNSLQTTGTVTFGQTTTGTGAITFNGGMDFQAGTRTLTVNVPTTLVGGITNGTGLTKGAAGTLTLLGSNTYTGTTQINTGLIAVQGANGALTVSNIIVGDNNGGDESMSFGQAADVVTGALNRIGDASTLTMNGRVAVTYTGPATGSGGFNETTGAITASVGLNTFTLVPGTGADAQVTPASLARTNTGTLFLRGAGLGTTGVGTTRLAPTAAVAVVGGGGAAGANNQSIVPWIVGDNSSTGAGNSFVVYDAVNGLRPLDNSEFDSTITGATANRNVSTAGGETVASSTRVNALRLTGAGTTTIGSGARLGIGSGAVLFTGAGTIGGAGTLDFGATEGVISVAGSAATTANISARIGGTGGLTVSSTGLLTNVLNLSGDNTAVGTLTLNDGTLQLGSATALNDNYPMTVVPRMGSILQLNGNNVTIRNLQAATGHGTYQNGAATPATLTTYLTADQTVATVLANGSTGVLNLVVGGGNVLTVSGDASATGTVEVRGGTVLMNGTTGTLNDFTGYTFANSTVRLTNTSAANNTNRLKDGVAIAMNGATLDFDNSAGAANYSETLGAVTLTGSNFITVDKAAAAQTSVLTLASLAHNPGGVVVFNSQNNGTAIFDLGTTTQSRVVLTAAPTLDDGIIGGWAVVQTAAATREFAKYVSSGTISVTALAGADYTTTLSTGSNPTQNVKLTAAPTALTADTQINSLTIQQAASIATDVGAGHVLRVESGGIILSGDFNSSITNGTLTAGTGANTPGELFIHVLGAAANPLTITSVIADNGTGSVSLTKAGAGTLDLQNATNTFTGKTYISGGTLRINGDAALGTAPASPSAGALTFALTGTSTLDVTGTMTLNANRSISVVSGTNIISIAAGTAGNGKTLTYNGSITSPATGEGSLRFQSNAVATTGVDPGKISASLTSLSLSGGLREDTGTVTLNGASNSVGRSLQVGMDGNGTLTYTTAGGSLTVGKGINDVLEVGVNASNVLTTVGTLNLAGLNQFTANVDTMRAGIGAAGQTGQAVITLANNNDITAGTSIALGGTAGTGNSGPTTTLVFGSGINNVYTKTFTVGGDKSKVTVTTAAGGTVNLPGFGANTMDLIVGAYLGTGTAGITNTLNMTGGTLNASINNLLVGQKTGGTNGGVLGVVTLGSTANAISANNVVLGNVVGNTTAGSNLTSGTINFPSGTFVINNDLAMATIGVNTGSTPTSAGIFNLTGGTLSIGGNITRTTTDEASSNSYLNVAGGALDMMPAALGDTTPGTMTVSQLAFRSGSIANVGSANLKATSTTNSGVAGTIGDALILRDTSVSFPIVLSGLTAGNVHYENAGGGTGGTIAGALDLGFAGRTFNVEDSAAAPADLTVSGAVSGAVTLTKTGAGTLLLNNTVAGLVQVNAGALGGTGSIAGSISVAGSATLVPGPAGAIGTLGAGTLDLQAGSNLVVQINSTAHTADLLELGGSLSLDFGNTTNLSVTDLNAVGSYLSSLDLIHYIGLWNGGLFKVGGTVIDDYDPSTNPNSASFVVGGVSYQIDYNANGNTVQLVPEPATGLVLLAGVGMLALRRRRR